MEQVTLTLNRSHPDFKAIETELTAYLQSLEQVSYEQTKVSPSPGTLQPIDTETVRMTIELATAVIELIAAIALIVSQVHAASSERPQARGRSTSVQLRVRGLDLSLPASDSTVRKFLSSMAGPHSQRPKESTLRKAERRKRRKSVRSRRKRPQK